MGEAVADAIAAGPVEVLLTHETVDGGCPRVERILRSNPMNWDAEALAYSALSRRRITELWEGVRPDILAHGHMHAPDQTTLPDGRRIYSLGSHGQRKNVGLLTLADLAWAWSD